VQNGPAASETLEALNNYAKRVSIHSADGQGHRVIFEMSLGAVLECD